MRPRPVVPPLVALLVLALAPLARAAAPALPPSDATAKAALEASPRHGEYVDVPWGGDGDAPLRTFVVHPERADAAGVVLVVHEVFGLTDWIRAVADAFAREGFIAVVPDLLSGLGPGGGGTDSVASRDDAVRLTRSLTRDGVAARLAAVRAHALAIPAANGRLATAGFCWGGTQSFAAAAADPPPVAAVVFYGAAPDSATLERIEAPVLGIYGADDARVNVTIEPAKARLAARKRRYETHVFEGAGHGFLRAQDGRDGANRRATERAWPLAIAFLRRHLGR